MNTRTTLLLILCLTVLACNTTRYPLFARSNGSPPPLANRSVIVLPPFGFGAEINPAIVGARAAKAVFQEPIAGVDFLPVGFEGNPTSDAESRLKELRRRLATALPLDLEPEGKQTTLLDDKHAGHRFILRERNAEALTSMMPASLPPELLAPYGGDYVLTMIGFGSYIQVDSIAALYGILPFMGTSNLRSTGPRWLFALYDGRTGRRVWETYLGLEAIANPAKKYDRLALDPREAPFLAAAYLLTGDAVTPFKRVVAPDNERRPDR